MRCWLCRPAAAILADACSHASAAIKSILHAKEQARNGTLRFAPGAEGDPSRARDGVPLGVSADGLLGSCTASPSFPAPPSTAAPRLAGISQALAARQHTGLHSRGIARHALAAHAFLRGWRQGLGLARRPHTPLPFQGGQKGTRLFGKRPKTVKNGLLF